MLLAGEYLLIPRQWIGASWTDINRIYILPETPHTRLPLSMVCWIWLSVNGKELWTFFRNSKVPLLGVKSLSDHKGVCNLVSSFRII